MDTLTREQWLARCATRFCTVGGIEPKFAASMAETCLTEMYENDLAQNPEDAADEEMSYWSD